MLACRKLILSCQDIFKFDPNYLENEEKYKEIKAEILGEDSDEDSDASDSDDGSEEAAEGKCHSITVTRETLLKKISV